MNTDTLDTALQPPESPPRGHRLLPVVLAGVGLLAVAEAFRLGLGELRQPGPGAWPLVAAVGVTVVAAWLAVTGIEDPEPVPLSDGTRIAAAIGGIAIFVVLLPLLGMPLPALLVLTLWMRLFGESWLSSILVGVAGTVVLQLLFVNLLAVALPVGPLAPGR